MKKIFILGATSAIAKATAKELLLEDSEYYLLARNKEKLKMLCDDLKVRGASKVHSKCIDVNKENNYEALVNDAVKKMGCIDIALIAHGVLPKQKDCEEKVDALEEALEVNAMSVVTVLTVLATQMESQKSGAIVAISSVAGDRGRQSNYVYGASKAMVSTFLQGLRNRLLPLGVNVIDIKPGFVDTPMTEEFQKGFLWAQPEDIAKGIRLAIKKKKTTVYLPHFWRPIMFTIRNIPEFVFNRLKL